MAIMFHNVKSGERRLCKTEPMIAAHLNTSNRSPNAHTGQDMGWRLAPETVIKLEEALRDPETIRKIAADFGLPTDNVSESDVLTWVSRQDDKSVSGENFTQEDFERKYEDDIRKLRAEQDQRDEVIAAEAKKDGREVPDRIKEKDDTITEEPEAPKDLSKLSRGDLNAYAEGLGIEKPEDIGKRADLNKLIKDKEAEEE